VSRLREKSHDAFSMRAIRILSLRSAPLAPPPRCARHLPRCHGGGSKTRSLVLALRAHREFAGSLRWEARSERL